MEGDASPERELDGGLQQAPPLYVQDPSGAAKDEEMRFVEERKIETPSSPGPIITGSSAGQDFTSIKVESVEDADDVLSHRPKYVE